MAPNFNILWQSRGERFFREYSVIYYTQQLPDGVALGAEIGGRLALLGWLDAAHSGHAAEHILQRWSDANLVEGTPSIDGWHLPLTQPAQPQIWPELSLIAVGTQFQIGVWQALLAIPCGRTATYGAVAKKLGRPTASRAVGTAIGANPLAVLIPCHRVLPASDLVGGYYWGPQRKQALLKAEAQHVKESESIAA